MSATLAASPTGTLPVHRATPTFFGIVRGELFKVSKQRATWFAALVLLAINFLPYLVEMSVGTLADRAVQLGPSGFLYNTMGNALTVFRVFVGPFLIIITARLIGMEYSSGTIRVLLSRGVGRLQLLGAKLLAVCGIAAATLVVGLLFHFVMSELLFATKLGLSFFAADNIGLIFFLLANKLTGSDFWLNVTGLLLGPNLNEMPHALLPNVPESATRAFQGPLVTVDGTHTIVVALVWSLAFLVVAGVLTWRRDVTE